MSEFSQSAAPFDCGSAGTASPIVFLTNRFNLLEILSSGLITPRAAFGKYYDDLLARAQGRIPLFQAPLSPDLTGRVSSRDDTSFPVALEIDPAGLARAPVTALTNDGATDSVVLEPGRAKIWAACGAIPSVVIQRVHFHSTSELEEHKLREYDNIGPGWIELTASPSLFEKGTLRADEAERWLASLQPIAVPSADDFAFHDRLAGARCLGVHAAPADLMDGLAVFLGSGNASTGLPHGFPSWLSVENTIRPRESGWRGRSTEERLYCSAVRVLRRINPAETWRPLQILSDVQAAVAGTQLPKKDETQLSKQFAAMGEILRNEREFKPFRSGVGSPVIKALLMILMRPEPPRLLSWPKAETGADDEVQLTAEVLGGVLQGHKRLSIDYRHPTLDRLIALTSAREICAGLRDAFRPTAERVQLDVSVEPASAKGDTTVTLKWDGVTVVRKENRRRLLVDLLQKLDLTNPGIAGVLADFCVEQAWTDCVRSVVTTTDRKWSAAPRTVGSGLEIVVLGPVSVRVEIEADALRERLRETTFPAADEEQLAERLRAVGAGREDLKGRAEASSGPDSKNPKSVKQPST
jgi:hypothetical protein